MARPIAVTRSEEYPYILEANRDDPEEEQTKFILRPLSPAGRRKVMNVASLDDDGKVSMNIGDRNWNALRYGLVRWDNFVDSAGNVIEFKPAKNGLASEEMIALIPDPDQTEIASEITGAAQLDEEMTGK